MVPAWTSLWVWWLQKFSNFSIPSAFNQLEASILQHLNFPHLFIYYWYGVINSYSSQCYWFISVLNYLGQIISGLRQWEYLQSSSWVLWTCLHRYFLLCTQNPCVFIHTRGMKSSRQLWGLSVFIKCLEQSVPETEPCLFAYPHDLIKAENAKIQVVFWYFLS